MSTMHGDEPRWNCCRVWKGKRRIRLVHHSFCEKGNIAAAHILNRRQTCLTAIHSTVTTLIVMYAIPPCMIIDESCRGGLFLTSGHTRPALPFIFSLFLILVSLQHLVEGRHQYGSNGTIVDRSFFRWLIQCHAYTKTLNSCPTFSVCKSDVQSTDRRRGNPQNIHHVVQERPPSSRQRGAVFSQRRFAFCAPRLLLRSERLR